MKKLTLAFICLFCLAASVFAGQNDRAFHDMGSSAPSKRFNVVCDNGRPISVTSNDLAVKVWFTDAHGRPYNPTKHRFNPKEHFLWKNFTIAFKEFIYSNKKFKNISKSFEMYTRKIDVVYASKKDKQFFLNYPTKIKNYIIDDYYRPFLKPCLKFFNSKYIQETHSYIKENSLRNPKFKEDNFYLIKFKRILPKSNEKDSI